MKKLLAVSLLLAMVAGTMTAALAAASKQKPRMAFRSFMVEGETLQGSLLEGWWEWTGSVTVKGSGLTLTCDSLKMWLTPDGRDAERVEGSGNIRIAGRYVTSDKTEWEVKGRAGSLSYEQKAGQAVLKGAVSFEAANVATGAVVSAEAEKLVYDTNSKRFRFEGGKRPVRMEWEKPEPEEASGEAPQEGSAE